jgi:hypothetical protein
VPKALADKVRAYYSYVVEREVQADEADIITGLSASLRAQVRIACKHTTGGGLCAGKQ